MATRLSTSTQNAAADAVAGRFDVGSTNAGATIQIYSGTQPASANDAASGTLLAAVVVDTVALGSASGGTATLLGVPYNTTGLADGSAAWFRVLDRDGGTVLDGSVGTSGAEMIVNSTTVSTGLDVEIQSLTISMPSE